MLENISKNVKTITVHLSGGFDSRLTLMVLEKVCKKHDIKLKSQTSGNPNHPDVILAEKVAKALNVPWKHKDYTTEKNLKPLPQHLREYAATFYQAQGDFDSHDFFTKYSRKIKNKKRFSQTGLDLYKRNSMSKLINFNWWSSRRRLSKTNFYFPLFSTNLELWFTLIFAKHYPKEKKYKEFIYNVLKRGNPDLLDIPFAFDSLPQVDIEKFESEGYTSTFHDPQPFLWDYEFVLNELDPILKTPFNEVDQKFDFILSKSGINPLDYFLLDKEIDKLLSKFAPESCNKTKEKLINLKRDSFYPKYRTYLKIYPDKDNYIKKRSLMKLMDYASSASFSSFESLEKYFKSKNYDSKEEIYNKFDESYRNKEELIAQSIDLKHENEKLKKDIDNLLSSNSWKITEPLRKIKLKRKH